MTIPAIASEEREVVLEEGLDKLIGLIVDIVVSEGYPSPGLNMRVEFLA
jgi:hypothetical protein